MNLLSFIPILALVTCQQGDFDPLLECPVLDLNKVCMERCDAVLLRCILDCPTDDTSCLSQCIRDGNECTNSCPCELNCLEGCTDCENPVCQCEEKESNAEWNLCIDDNGSKLGRCIYACNNDYACEDQCVDQFKTRQYDCPCEDNCPGGCPCDDYPCIEATTAPEVSTSTAPATTTAPATNAVLVLSTQNSANKPMVIDWEGNFNDDLNFEYGDETTVNQGCSATLMGQFWYFGGSGANKRQLSKIVGCELVRQNDLTFDFTYGACNSFTHPTPKVLLCFDYTHTSECHTFDGEYSHTVGSSKFSHKETYGIMNYKNQAVTTGCNHSSVCYIKTELMNMETLEWSDGPDFPFASVVSYYSTAATSDTAYLIGGYQDASYSTTIAEFKNNQWRKLGNLNQGRRHHGSISVGSRTMVVGGYTAGYDDAITEVWELGDENNKIISPTLPSDQYFHGIALFPVNADFCRK